MDGDHYDRSQVIAYIAELQARVDKEAAKKTFEVAALEAEREVYIPNRSKALAKIAESQARTDKKAAKRNFYAAIKAAQSIYHMITQTQNLKPFSTLLSLKLK